jgi:hypothetical protein
MTRRALLASVKSIAMFALVPQMGISSVALAQSAELTQTQAIAAAATVFLNTLDDRMRAGVQFPFAPQPLATAAHFKGGMRGNIDMIGERYGGAVWSNYPVSDVPRSGLRLGSLDCAQRGAAMTLLRALLSSGGYRKVQDIMGSDQTLADAGQPYACGRGAYTLAIFGVPSVDTLWMVQFGGHHLALNVTMLGGHAVLAPVLTGCMPAIYTENGRQIRALAAENDKAFALLGSLDDVQRRRAIIDHRVSELVLGPGHDGKTVSPAGVKASYLDQRQRDILFGLILEWVGILNDIHAAPRLAEIRDGMDDTWFAWSGPTTHEADRNGASYFRVQGPKLFVESAPQEPGGDLTMHVHTIYRDLQNAYGRGLV